MLKEIIRGLDTTICNHIKIVTDDEIVVRKGGSTASGWTSWNGNAEITAATGKHIAIVVSNTNAVVAAGETTVTAKA